MQSGDALIQLRAIQTFDTRAMSYAIQRTVRCAARRPIDELFDDLALHMGMTAHRVDATSLLLDAPGVFILPDPCMCRYWITASGRFLDSDGNDLEPSGYITFYAYPKDRASGDSSIDLVEYRAKFLDGNLDSIVRVRSAGPCEVRYGLASFRWFQSRSFLFGDGTDDDTPV